MTVVRDRPFDQATQIRIDRALLRQASRDRLKRVREALRRIQAELEAAVREHRKSVSMGTFAEERWLQQIESLRLDLEMLEI
jgi:hypothetical protein